MVGTDIMISIVILLLAGGLVYYFILNPERKKDMIMELEEDFFLANFKDNLQKQPVYNFLQGYKVNDARLLAFAALPDNDVETFVLDGLGVNNVSYDVCLFFEGSSGIIPVNGKSMLGEVYTNQAFTVRGSCSAMLSDPCEYYKKVINFIMPVLKNRKVIRMHMIVCKQE